ncbi:hypothetical protein [Pediococcus inopinatus]|jgi:hypothetical protein|uniref:Uncharacterized protein n=3 Tax=Lactobacillaceae TaxID=33958 RepID=A0A0R1Q6R1_9LACO|nr:hypothetical protein [Pediococcus inopinatus]KRL38042.1 hypothetical protein FD20_GL002307 [Liquorilactobacillus uvarum DSM 19971]KRN62172.1 hypothetical protein IV83_GL000406 [Pediococcus inopinatus]KRO10066.1 hypothetical protein IV59_GL002269 [Paucilactobacillus hokkaidonensis]BAP86385.1 hypothetical protein LOOC260_118790 [Paucilactobacillus hokkaidonensis JCM 18461]
MTNTDPTTLSDMNTSSFMIDTMFQRLLKEGSELSNNFMDVPDLKADTSRMLFSVKK